MQYLITTTQTFMTTTNTNLKNQVAAIHNLEVQMSQIFSLLSNRPQGSLPSNTEVNPKEHIKAITLRSEKVLEQDQVSREENLLQQTLEMKTEKKKRRHEIYRAKIRPASQNFGQVVELWEILRLCKVLQRSQLSSHMFPHFQSPRNTSKRLQISSLFNF